MGKCEDIGRGEFCIATIVILYLLDPYRIYNTALFSGWYPLIFFVL